MRLNADGHTAFGKLQDSRIPDPLKEDTAAKKQAGGVNYVWFGMVWYDWLGMAWYMVDVG